MYQIPLLMKYPNMVHAFSTTDEGNMGNVILGKLMDTKEVLKNRKTLLDKVGVDENKTICMWVEHGDRVVKADAKFAGISIKDWKKTVKCDAISTNSKNLFLFLLIADCIPVIFFDQVKHVVGLMHYGWKNADLNLAKTMITHLNKHYGCSPGDLIIGFGPAVRKKSYIKENPAQLGKSEWKGYVKAAGGLNFSVDVVGLCRKQLLNEGIKKKNLFDCRIDVFQDVRFFSRTRALQEHKEDQARFACVVGLI